jgi:hypothetical protein
MPHHSAVNAEVAQCIDDCHHCAATCQTTLAHCLEMGGKHADAQHIALMLDCAAMCETAAASMSRNSSVHSTICGACAEICRQCETDCRTFRDDPAMKDCADMCARCAESCEKMAA